MASQSSKGGAPVSDRAPLSSDLKRLARDMGFELVNRSNQQAEPADADDQPEVKLDAVVPRPLRVAATRATSALRGMRGKQVVRTRMVSSAQLVSSAGGTCYSSFAVYTAVVALGEFTDFSNLFDEFKVVEMRSHYIPLTPNKVEAAVNTNGRSLIWAFDSTDSTVPTGMQVLWANETASVWSNQAAHRSVWKTSASQPSVWYSTLSATNPLYPACGWKLAGDANLGATTILGDVWYEFFVEFRARR